MAVGEHTATVRLGGNSGCSTCDAGRGCGAGIFGRMLKKRPVDVELEKSMDAREGDAVIVGLPESLFLRLSLLMYLFPLVCLLAGAAVGHGLAVATKASAPWADLVVLIFGVIAAMTAFRAVGKLRFELSWTDDVHIIRNLNMNHQNLIERTICE